MPRKFKSIGFTFTIIVALFIVDLLLTVGSTVFVAISQTGDAGSIDTAARQRRLVLELDAVGGKLVLALESESSSGELVRSVNTLVQRFDEGIGALDQGGVVVDDRGESSYIPPVSAPLRGDLEAATRAWDRYRAALAVLTADGVDVVSDAFYDAVDSLRAEQDPLIEAAAGLLHGLKTESQRKVELLILIQWIALAIGLGIGLAAWLIVRFKVTRPILKLSRAMNEIEQTANLSRRVDPGGDDEVGLAAVSFNRMLEAFERIVTRVADGVERLHVESTAMAGLSERSREAISRQLLEIGSIAAGMTEMGASAREVGRNTEAAAGSTRQAADKAGRGRDVLARQMDQTRELSQTVSGAVDKLAQLSEHSGNIGGILDVIRGISEQTNLLALNAAIEAARAGEQGRGFAVVAEEVRTLASRTHAATSEIQTVIEDLQASATGVAELMRRGGELAGRASHHAEETEHALDEILQAVLAIDQMNQQIALATQEQVEVSEDFARRIETARMAADETSEISVQAADASAKVTGHTDDLDELVKPFAKARA